MAYSCIVGGLRALGSPLCAPHPEACPFGGYKTGSSQLHGQAKTSLAHTHYSPIPNATLDPRAPTGWHMNNNAMYVPYELILNTHIPRNI